MLTNDDLNKIQLLIMAGSNQVIKRIDEVDDKIQRVEKSIKLLPAKEEHFDSMDKLMGEIKKSREEQEIIGEQLSNHSDRLEKLEEKVGISVPN